MNDKMKQAIEAAKWIAVVVFIQFYIYMAIDHLNSGYFIALNLIIGFVIIFCMAFEANYDK